MLEKESGECFILRKTDPFRSRICAQENGNLFIIKFPIFLCEYFRVLAAYTDSVIRFGFYF
ncbi:hypothetical protein CH375_19200 [Leptospira ellisii]|uniref:Uncharacterized protein n=1 Tax=Leptospira ellisii TaxID=2023197 RepID=A0A2N0BGE3_9LEPT|nr:hypothetical protein CH379_13535 [Leptospira ellisii]PKA03067.1 hypothetical protein CH375_19200 [Leptospira ellisii]